MENLINEPFILKLFNLQEKQIESFHIRHDSGIVVVQVKLKKTEVACTVCESSACTIKDYTLKKITHSALKGHHCVLEYQARRYKCKNCNKCFYESNPFSLSGMKISQLTVYNVLEDLKSPTETLVSISKRHYISPTTVASIFDNYVSIPRNNLPRILCIDEVYAFKSKDSKYVCVLLDYINQSVVDLLPSRKKNELSSYLYGIPLKEREQVELVCIDMWETYRTITKTYFRNAKLSVDKFHVLQEFTKQFNSIRVKVMNWASNYQKVDIKTATLEERQDYYHNDNLYYVFKKFNWLLYSRDNEKLDVNSEKKMNRKLQRYMNFYDLLMMMLESSTELSEAYNLQYYLYRFYALSNEYPKEELEILIAQFQNSNSIPMNRFAKTLILWKTEILNSFITIDEYLPNNESTSAKLNENKKVNRVTNAIIENRNKVIKTLKRNANGFTNWSRFRNRVMYVINENAHHRLYKKE